MGVEEVSVCRVTLVLLSIAVALAGCASPRPSSEAASSDADASLPPPGPRVNMETSKFMRATLEVSVGSTVTWVNRDQMGHTVTPTDKAHWGSEGSGDDYETWIGVDEWWSFKFSKPGTYEYYCIPHGNEGAGGKYEGMAGTIVVS